MLSENSGCQALVCDSRDIDGIPDSSTDLHSKPSQLTYSVSFLKTKKNIWMTH